MRNHRVFFRQRSFCPPAAGTSLQRAGLPTGVLGWALRWPHHVVSALPLGLCVLLSLRPSTSALGSFTTGLRGRIAMRFVQS